MKTLKFYPLFLLLTLFLTAGLPLPALADNPLTAKPTLQSVYVDGELVNFNAYNILDNNYFQLRDIAFALSGTKSQFEVNYDAQTNIVIMTSGKAHTVTSDKMTGRGSDIQLPTPTQQTIFLNGKKLDAAGYNIGGNNYFKLRDIGQAIDFEVQYDAKSNCIQIISDLPYTGNNYAKAENTPADTKSFYFAHFDVITDNNVKASIPNLILRFHGTIDHINPADLTDTVLMRDGKPIENRLVFNGRIDQATWGYEDITDFYFSFEHENREPGRYSFTGKFAGVPFTVYDKVLEAPLSNIPADPDALRSVGYVGFPSNEDNTMADISEVSFFFNGVQQVFYLSDLTDLKLTRDGVEIAFAFRDDHVFRYLETEADGVGTSFCIIFKEEITTPGTYQMKGKYQGKPFTSMEITVR